MHDRDVVPEAELSIAPVAAASPMTAVLASTLRHNRRNAGLLLALLAALLILAIFSPKYMNLQNFIVVGLQMSYIGIASLGMTLLIISGNVDLSIGSLFALSAVVASLLALHIDPQVALLVAILLGGA